MFFPKEVEGLRHRTAGAQVRWDQRNRVLCWAGWELLVTTILTPRRYSEIHTVVLGLSRHGWVRKLKKGINVKPDKTCWDLLYGGGGAGGEGNFPEQVP